MLIATEGAGDALLAFPLMHLLSTSSVFSVVHVMTVKQNAPLFHNLPCQIIVIKPTPDRCWRSSEVNSYYDCVVNLNLGRWQLPSISCGTLISFSEVPPPTCSFARHVRLPRTEENMRKQFLRFALSIGLSNVPENGLEAFGAIPADASSAPAEPFQLVAISKLESGASPEIHMAMVARAIARRPNLPVVLTGCTSREQEVAKSLESLPLNAVIVNRAGLLSLPEFIGHVKASVCVISIDSLACHVADIFQKMLTCYFFARGNYRAYLPSITPFAETILIDDISCIHLSQDLS
jgi:ADP-heptose:LPS heptosyltransferase